MKISNEGIFQTLTGRAGTGGNNTPLVAEPDYKSYGISKEAYNSGIKSGFNFAVNEEISPTLQTGIPHAVGKPEIKAFNISAKYSDSNMKEAETSKTFDTTCGNPCCHQGGTCVVESVPETSNNLETYDIRFTSEGTKNSKGEHYCTSKNSQHTCAVKEQANTLVASDYKDPPCVNDTPNEEIEYIVRRLTPTECLRLQGLPDYWCDDLAIPNPTDEDIAFWMKVWEEWNTLNGKKPKTVNQVRKWLADPCTDSAIYKMVGNAICLPCGYFVLSGIARYHNKERGANPEN